MGLNKITANQLQPDIMWPLIALNTPNNPLFTTQYLTPRLFMQQLGAGGVLGGGDEGIAIANQ
jgi:hypothetical protein|nr:hypothetical protein [Yersinia rochesterensis]